MTAAVHAGAPFTLNQLYRSGDRLMSGVQWLLLLLAILLASWHGTWFEAFIIGLPAALVPSLLTWLQPGARLTRVSHGLAFMIFAALHIHQAHGMIEVHFGIFVFLAFLLFYRDWLPIVAAAGLIAVHHFVFNLLQASGLGVYVFAGRTGWDLVAIHAAYVVFETLVLVIMAYRGQRESRQVEEVSQLASGLVVRQGQVELTLAKTEARSEIAQGMNAFVKQLLNTLVQTQAASQHLTEALPQTLGSMKKTAQLMQQQESSVTDLIPAVHQVTSAFHEISGHAQQAAETVAESEQQAQQGQQNLQSTQQLMEALVAQVNTTGDSLGLLQQESEAIGEVLGVITQIAEQTNLLALNAAIEAARAGDSGRGFAVVADEVRNLASHTHDSTQKISGMITRLQERSQQAVKDMALSQQEATEAMTQIQQTSQVLHRILAATFTINQMNQQIAQSTEAQSQAINLISEHLSQVSELAAEAGHEMSVTQAASEQMQDLALQLDQATQRFILP